MVSEVFYLPLQGSAALQPWVLWSVARPAAGFGRKAVPIGVVFGLLFLLGDVFAVLIALIVSLLWIALEVPRPERLRQAGALVAGILLGGLLAAPQIVATALLVPETQRAVTGIRLEEGLAFTLSPWRLAELVVPYPFGDFWTLEDREAWGSPAFRVFFVTLYAGAFAFVALVAFWRDRRRGARFGRTLFVVGVVAATVFRLVPSGWSGRTSWIPLRFPEKFAVAIAFALAVLVGIAFDRFRGRARRPAWIFGVAIGLAGAAGAARLFPELLEELRARRSAPRRPMREKPAGSWPRRSRKPGCCGSRLSWPWSCCGVRSRGRAIACTVILTLVPIFANRRIARVESEASVFPPTAFARTIARLDPQGAYRTIDATTYRPTSPFSLLALAGDPYATESNRNNWSWAASALWDRGTVFNLDPDRGDFSRMESLRRVSGRAGSTPEGAVLFSGVGLRFGIRYRDQPPLPGFRHFGGDAFRVWDVNPDALPDLRLLEQWREEPGALAALESLSGLAAGEVIVETDRRASGTARPGVLRVVEKSPERLILETSSPDPTWLFALRGYGEYRTIRVDGTKVEAVPAQLAFSAIPVPAGEHRIEWREEVPGLAISRWGPVLFALGAGLLLVPRRLAMGRAA